MNRRTQTGTVRFSRPFTLAGWDEILPAGTYEVETDEELVEGISFAAYRKVQVLIHLPPSARHPGLARTLTIDPAALDAALLQDQAGEDSLARLADPSRRDDMTANAHEPPITAEELARYGITRVPVDYFHLGDFRYTSLSDAIAQAKRRAAAVGGT